MAWFHYDDALLRRFPSTYGAAIHATGVRNNEAAPAITRAFLQEQEAALQQLGGRPLSGLPSISAWRRVFTGFGVKPTQYRNAAEALLRRLTKKGEIPPINPLVDLGNLVSIRYALPVAVFDMQHIAGGLTVRFADGTEHFVTLGTTEAEHPEPGEVVFVDEDGMVSARRWCWRQSEASAAQADTSEILVTIEGHHDGASTDVQAAANDLLEFLVELGARDVQSALLSRHNPIFPEESVMR